MSRRILLPTDGSKGARRGVERALEEAEREGAVVHALFVVDEHRHGPTPALGSDELFLEEIEMRAEEALDEIVRAGEQRGVDVVKACVRGRSHEAILDYAARNDIDLIVMGTHGESARARPHVHVGGCTHSVLRSASVPVVTV